MIVDGEAEPGMIRKVGRQAWAAVAELPNQYAALAVSASFTPESLAVTTVNSNAQHSWHDEP